MDYGMDYQGGGGFNGGGNAFGGTGGAFDNSAGYNGGGGGFQNSPGAMAGGPGSPPPSSNSNRRRSQEEQTILPVTISMILRGQSDTNGVALSDGRPLHHVKVVAAIRSCEANSTNTMFQVEDGTGAMEVKQWSDSNACSKALAMQEAVKREHIYAAIYGEVKDYDGKKSLVASSMRPITTGNELTHHMLEVVFQAEKHKKGGSAAAAPPMQGVGFGAPSRAPLQMASGDSPLRESLMELVRTKGNMTDSGLTTADVVNCFRGKFTEPEIRQGLQGLTDEGHLYTTVNEDTYKSSS